MKKIVTWITIIILVVIIGFIYFRFYFVYGQGVSAGELNYVVKSGYIFKTYEGKMIQSGFGSKLAGALQSHEFNFSVDNDSVAVKLMVNSSKMVELHYKQYFGSLPWRGNSRFVVDSIISIQEARAPSGIQ
jgi:uncharacterized protein YxeA